MKLLEVLKYVFIGIVQGFTEVLPISSSAHLAFFCDLINIEENNVAFRVFLHLASLLATLIFLRKKILILIKSFFSYLIYKSESDKNNFYFCVKLFISTVPIVIFTLLFKDLIDSINMKLYFIGILLVINGLSLAFFSNLNLESKEEVNFKDALVIGLFQCFGAFSGISRSGSCINGASFRGIKKEKVSELVFLMLVPAVIGAFVLEISNIKSEYLLSDNLALYLISFFVSFACTLISFNILKLLIINKNYKYFSLYSLIMGLIIFVYGMVN